MATEALRIDGDDLDLDLLPAIERSFGLQLEQADIDHVRTFGDLHALVLAKAPGISGAACGTMIAFHQLRRALGLQGVESNARPDLPLRMYEPMSPRRLREYLVSATGLELPVPGPRGRTLLPLVAFPLLALLIGRGEIAVLALPVTALVIRLDRGSWAGEWATLGSLASATAALNHAALVRRGARHSPRSVWNTLRNLLAPYGASARDVGADTWLTTPPRA